MQGWTHRIGMDTSVAARNIAGRDEASHAALPEPTRHKWSIQKEIRRAGIGRSPHWVRDSYTLSGALNCIEEHFISSSYDRADPDIPLLLKVSLIQPHYPFLTDRRDRFDHYLNRVHPFLDQHPFDHPVLGGDRFVARPGVEVGDRECRRAVAAYYAMIESCDTAFGVVLDALRHAGQDLDDWIVIYTSDHGEMLGEHAVWYKSRFFEAAARVPLIVRYPRRYGPRTVNANVSLCDLFATLCDLTDVPVPEGLDSRSLISLLDGDSSQWPDEAVSQFDGTQLMIKRGHLKYQYYGPDAPEVLFDLGGDPQETTNAIDNDEHALSVQQFRRRRAELGF
jgi:choline-sulfatase